MGIIDVEKNLLSEMTEERSLLSKIKSNRQIIRCI